MHFSFLIAIAVMTPNLSKTWWTCCYVSCCILSLKKYIHKRKGHFSRNRKLYSMLWVGKYWINVKRSQKNYSSIINMWGGGGGVFLSYYLMINNCCRDSFSQKLRNVTPFNSSIQLCTEEYFLKCRIAGFCWWNLFLFDIFTWRNRGEWLYFDSLKTVRII